MKRVVALVLANIGVVALVATFLPIRGEFSYSSQLERWFVMRERWDIVLGVALGTALVSAALILTGLTLTGLTLTGLTLTTSRRGPRRFRRGLGLLREIP